jgi:hypothetical protein
MGGSAAYSTEIYRTAWPCTRRTPVQYTVKEKESSKQSTPAQIRSYMHMYAFALRTSSSVVRRTTWSLMYAHCRGRLPVSAFSAASCPSTLAGADAPVGGSAVYAT